MDTNCLFDNLLFFKIYFEYVLYILYFIVYLKLFFFFMHSICIKSIQ